MKSSITCVYLLAVLTIATVNSEASSEIYSGQSSASINVYSIHHKHNTQNVQLVLAVGHANQPKKVPNMPGKSSNPKSTNLDADMNSAQNVTLAHQPLSADDEMSQGLPLYLKILASVFYPIAMILGIGGNTLVLLVIVFLRFTKSVTTFFIINLAISDLIFALLCIPPTFITAYLFQYWPFSAVMCIFFNYMQTVSVTLTVYTLIWITIDKFWGLVKPLKLRMSLKICKLLIALSWLFSLLASLPIAIFTKLSDSGPLTQPQFQNNNSNQTDNHQQQQYQQQALPQCGEQWPDTSFDFSQLYNILLLLIQYFIPLVILSYCYIKIGLRLKKSKAPGESIQMRDAKMTESRKKILKMCFIMVLTFMVFWAPLHFINIYRFYDKRLESWSHFGDIFFICHVLAVSRTFVNPFIYAWSNPRFRAGFQYFMCCYCCCLMTSARRNKFSSSFFLLYHQTSHYHHHHHQCYLHGSMRGGGPVSQSSSFRQHRYSLYGASQASNATNGTAVTATTAMNTNSNAPTTGLVTTSPESIAALRRQRFRTVDHACGCRSINFSTSMNSSKVRLASTNSKNGGVETQTKRGSNEAIEF